MNERIKVEDRSMGDNPTINEGRAFPLKLAEVYAGYFVQSISHQENSQKAENKSPDKQSHRKHPRPIAAFGLLFLFVGHFSISYRG
jgi:hypothetical protein